MKRRGWCKVAAAVLAATLFGGSAAAADTGLLDFSAAERRSIVQHGPWPPRPARDPGNAVAGRADAVALGQRLFFDPRLSADGSLSCASCHRPEAAFADGQPRSIGRVVLDRNAPSLWNAAHERWYGWDGAADSLWSQSIRPILDAREMAASAILGTLMLGFTFLAHHIGAVPSDTGETVISQVARTVFDGRNLLYLLTIASTTLILIMAATTAFADFPRLAFFMARDGYLPGQFGNRGDRLVFSNGILILGGVAAFLLVIFRGSTHALITPSMRWACSLRSPSAKRAWCDAGGAAGRRADDGASPSADSEPSPPGWSWLSPAP